MTARSIKIDAGGEGAELTIVVTGSECRCEDLQMFIAAKVREFLARPKTTGSAPRPCGCKENQ
ncbi:hypothetical protein [Fimbriimonas ginsengisoli]|uniref:Uncharacterized protein n=1 Tax=Fimbriimonas ginsengisoli Gsoil 348 TaxID=661478 RepID=A0A068NLC7_FIMGI|nr:hypothetical protein [Fimbriimonas ginsengisoli]AIE83540.1 hypothetical protein OP10G_0172 [Fimbriimonas ginsengisoli Gsoil 348]